MGKQNRNLKCAVIIVLAALAVITYKDNALGEKNYHISRPKLAFELSYEFDNDQRTGPFINRDDKTTTYSERIDIETDGWIYHPALVVYTLTLSPEWEQISEESDGSETNDNDTFLMGYDAEFIFFQYKPYTITLFGSQELSTVNSSVGQKSVIESTIYGIQLDLKYSILPTVINYTHDETDQKGFFTSTGERDLLQVNMKYDRNYGNTNIDMAYLDATDITGFSNTGTTSKNVAILNIAKLTGKGNKTLSSFLEYRDRQSNIFIERGFNWREGLRWAHSKNFTTNYNIHVESIDLQEGKTRENQLYDFELTHLLYENLITSMRLHSSKSHNESGQESIYGGNLDWSYVRKIPWGRLNINVTQAYTVYDKQPNFSANSINVPQELITLTGTDRERLNNINIITSSIRVFDNSLGLGIKGAERPASDYDIVTVGSTTFINRSIFSTLPDPADVIVEYSYIGDPPFDFSVYDRSYGFSLYLWDSLDLYYRVIRSNQHFLRGAEPETLRTYRNTTLGSEFTWEFSTTTFEYTNIASTDLPLESWRATETLVFRPTERIYLSLNAGFGRTRFKEVVTTADSERFQNYRAIAQMILSRRSSLRLQGSFDKTYGIVNELQNTGFQALYEWAYNIYTAEISYDFYDGEDKTANETFKNHLFLVKIKRSLF